MINRIRILLLLLLLALIALSYHPAFNIFVGVDTAPISTLSKYIYAITALLTVASFSPSFLKSRFALIYLFHVATIVIFGLFFLAIGLSKSYINNVVKLVMPLLFIMFGYSIRLTKKELFYIIIFYATVLIYTGITQIFNGLGGFVISMQYLSFNKNGFGGMLMTACLVILILFFNTKKPLFRIIELGLIVMLLIVDLTIRARGALLAFVVSGLVLLLIRSKYHKIDFSSAAKILCVFLFVCIILPIIIDPSIIFEYVNDALFMNKDGDFTSGRTERNQKALIVLNENPLFGLLATNEHIPWVHNFLLLQLSNYGILGSLPIVALYFFILLYWLKKSLNVDITKIENLGYFVLIISYIISLGEPTQPFSPGSVVFFGYFLFGYSMFNKK